MGSGETVETASVGFRQCANSSLPVDAGETSGMGSEEFIRILFACLFAAFEFDRNSVAEDEILLAEFGRLHFV